MQNLDVSLHNCIERIRSSLNRQPSDRRSGDRSLGSRLPNLAILLLVAVSLGLWYVQRQLGVLDPRLIDVTPFYYVAETVAEVGFFVFLAHLTIILMLDWLAGRRIGRYLELLVAVGFAPLAFVRFGLPLSAALGIDLVVIATAAALALRAGGIARIRASTGEPFAALLIVAAGLYLCNPFVSPAYWHDPISVGVGYLQQEQPAIMPVYRSFVWSKLFSFSDFDYSYWASVPYIPTTYTSYPLRLLTFLLDEPSIDPAAFHRVYQLVLYLLLVFGSFSAYLLLRVSAGLSAGAAIGGGIVFALGNNALIYNMVAENHLMISAYAVFPFVLFMLFAAFRRGSPLHALWAGMGLALQFYLAAPHPEGTIYSILYLSIFGLFWLLGGTGIGSNAAFGKRLWLSGLAGLAFVVFSLGHVLPILEAELTDLMHVFGHFDKNPPLGNWFSVWEYPINVAPIPEIYKIRNMTLLGAAFAAVGAIHAYAARPRASAVFWATLVCWAFLVLLHFPPTGRVLFPVIRGLGINLNPDAYERSLIWFYFALGILVAHGVDAFHAAARVGDGWGAVIKQYYFRHYVRMRLLFLRLLPTRWWGGQLGLRSAAKHISIAALVAAAVAGGMLVRPVKDGIGVDNPDRCPFYITLEANLANFPGLAKDPANTAYLRARLVRFEHDATRRVRLDSRESGIGRSDVFQTQETLKQYRQALRTWNAETVKQLADREVADAARAVAPAIDRFYLEKPSCVDPVDFGPGPFKRTVRYNLDALFSGITEPSTRILGAVKIPDPDKLFRADALLGIGAGFLNHSALTSFDNRFMMGYPLIHAIYAIPGYDYVDRGYYNDPITWALKADQVLNPTARTLLESVGVDIFVVPQSTYDTLANKDGLIPVPYHVSPLIDPHYVVLRDTRSSGTAYLADTVRPAELDSIQQAEKTVIGYFHNRVSRKEYDEVVAKLTGHILALPGPRAAIVEFRRGSNLAAASASQGAPPPGKVTIEGIVGPRAAMSAECTRPQCILVFNVAALPGWHAFVDRDRAQTLRANYGVLATVVPQGRHLVWFVYQPWRYAAALWPSMLGLLGLLWYSRGRFGDAASRSTGARCAQETPDRDNA